MEQCVLDAETCRRLREAKQAVELCDGSGQVIGVFLPESGPQGVPPDGLDSALSREEIDRRRSARVGRTLDEILHGIGK